MNKTDSIISDYFKHKVCYKEVTITHGFTAPYYSCEKHQ